MKILIFNLFFVSKMDKNSLAHTKWECKYHIGFAPKYRRKVIYKEIRADRIIFMDGGYIVEEGTPQQIFENPKNEKTRQFLVHSLNKG